MNVKLKQKTIFELFSKMIATLNCYYVLTTLVKYDTKIILNKDPSEDIQSITNIEF